MFVIDRVTIEGHGVGRWTGRHTRRRHGHVVGVLRPIRSGDIRFADVELAVRRSLLLLLMLLWICKSWWGSVVNFANVLLAAFAPKFFCQKIAKPNKRKIKAAQKTFVKKAARKILMKLTPVRRRHWLSKYWSCRHF